MKRIILLAIALTAMAFIKAQTSQRLPEYDQARKFTEQKLKTMLFSTQVRPHWMPSGEGFWYEYKTSKGTEWIYVNPSRKEKKPQIIPTPRYRFSELTREIRRFSPK